MRETQEPPKREASEKKMQAALLLTPVRKAAGVVPEPRAVAEGFQKKGARAFVGELGLGRKHEERSMEWSKGRRGGRGENLMLYEPFFFFSSMRDKKQKEASTAGGGGGRRKTPPSPSCLLLLLGVVIGRV